MKITRSVWLQAMVTLPVCLVITQLLVMQEANFLVRGGVVFAVAMLIHWPFEWWRKRGKEAAVETQD